MDAHLQAALERMEKEDSKLAMPSQKNPAAKRTRSN